MAALWERKEEVSSVCLDRGGGQRRKQIDWNSRLEEVLKISQDFYFPSRKSKAHGLILSLHCSLESPYSSNIYLTDTIDGFMQKAAAKYCKFILRTRKYSFLDERLSSSDDDFFNSPTLYYDTTLNNSNEDFLDIPIPSFSTPKDCQMEANIK